MPAALKKCYAANPGTTRGKPTVLNIGPKGDKIVYAYGNMIVIRDIADTTQSFVYTEHSTTCTVAKISPSGFYCASADIGGTVRIWDLVGEDHICKLDTKIISGPIYDLDWDMDSKRLVVAGEGKEFFGKAIMWDTGNTIGSIDMHSKPIQSISYKPTRPFRVVTGSEDLSVNWYEGPPFKYKNKLKEHTRYPNCVRFSPDGSKFFTVGSDMKGFLYDGKTAEKIGELAAEGAHTGAIYSAAWSPDSQQILTCSADKTSKLWDANTFACLQTFSYSASPTNNDMQMGACWAGDNPITVNLVGEMNYLDPNNPTVPAKQVLGHNQPCTALCAAPGKLFTASIEGLIRMWDGATGMAAGFTGKPHSNKVIALKMSGDKLVSVGQDDMIIFSDTAAGAHGAAIDLGAMPRGMDTSGDTVVVVTEQALLTFQGEAKTGEMALNFPATCVAIHGNVVAIGGEDNKVHLFENGAEVAAMEQHKAAVTCMEFSPDGSMLGSADANKEVVIWDIPAKDTKRTGMKGFHASRVTCCAWSPDGTYLATGSIDCSVYVWNSGDKKNPGHIKLAHMGSIDGVTFTCEGLIGTTGMDACLKLWEYTA